MPGTAEAAASTADAGGGFVPNQVAMLVPTFDPAKDDLTVYSQKVSLLLASWPEGKYNELATRLILGCSGSAFNKLQIHASEVTQNDRKHPTHSGTVGWSLGTHQPRTSVRVRGTSIV